MLIARDRTSERMGATTSYIVLLISASTFRSSRVTRRPSASRGG